MERYFRARERLSRAHCLFVCSEGCSRPGCTDEKLEVRVSLFDLLAISDFKGRSPDELLHEAFCLGLFKTPWGSWTREVALRLLKPCPFFQHPHCTVYPVRPTACMLFPELQFLSPKRLNELRELLGPGYHCLEKPSPITDERKKALMGLLRLYGLEQCTTSFYLFGSYPFSVELSSLKEEMLLHMSRKERLPDTGKVALEIDNSTMEEVFREKLKDTTLWKEIRRKVLQLSHSEGILQLQQTKRLISHVPLRGDGSIEAKWVFKFDGSCLKPVPAPSGPIEDKGAHGRPWNRDSLSAQGKSGQPGLTPLGI